MEREFIPDIYVEQYLLGELSEEKAHELEAVPGFIERVDTLRRETARFIAEHPPQQMARRIRNRYSARSTMLRRGARALASVRFLPISLSSAAALVLVAFAVFSVVGTGRTSVSGTMDDIVRSKGLEAHILLYRATSPDSVERLSDGETVREGDRIQIEYNAGERRFGAIVSVDGRGAVTLHYPVSASSDPALVGGGDHQLQYAYQLDDAPSFERFYFITSDASFNVGTLLARIRGEAHVIAAHPDRNLELGKEFTVSSVLLRKGD